MVKWVPFRQSCPRHNVLHAISFSLLPSTAQQCRAAVLDQQLYKLPQEKMNWSTRSGQTAQHCCTAPNLSHASSQVCCCGSTSTGTSTGTTQGTMCHRVHESWTMTHITALCCCSALLQCEQCTVRPSAQHAPSRIRNSARTRSNPSCSTLAMRPHAL